MIMIIDAIDDIAEMIGMRSGQSGTHREISNVPQGLSAGCGFAD
jgi:hypothetical protein